MNTRDFVKYGSLGFFSGFCTLGMASPKELRAKEKVGVIAGTASSGGFMLILWHNDYNILLPYTLGVIAGALTSTALLNGFGALECAASASPSALKM
jgi:hypothetical protein